MTAVPGAPGWDGRDAPLVERLVAGQDAYVDDAFGAAHRAHATTEGVAHLLPGYAGLLLEREGIFGGVSSGAVIHAALRLADELDPEAPWAHPDAAELDATTFEAWLRREVADEMAQDLLRSWLAGGFLAKPAHTFSLLQGLWMIAGAGGTYELFEPDQCLAYRVVGGSQLIPIRMAEELGLDIERCERVRLAGLKFADDRDTSPLDLLLNSGSLAIFWSARTFVGFMRGTIAGRGKHWTPYLGQQPMALAGGQDGMRRDPTSIGSIVYLSLAPDGSTMGCGFPKEFYALRDG
jgi:hypothetical protein